MELWPFFCTHPKQNLSSIGNIHNVISTTAIVFYFVINVALKRTDFLNFPVFKDIADGAQSGHHWLLRMPEDENAIH